jgi:tetratricopeptide (TPR) repeat protein
MTSVDPDTPRESGRRRYLGTRPYTDSPEDRARFFGRPEESKQLYLRVLSVPLLVQFGRSGLGKTSLLQAGLFPLLRQRPFLPVMVRLHAAGDSLAAAVVQSMKRACDAEGLEFAPGDTTGLWELLKTTAVWRGDFLLTPVLVFDQFEEVFTLRDAAFRAQLATELGALASGIAPPRATASSAPPHVKIIISLREDYLGALEEFAAAIPGLFHERLRLGPLGENAARDAIIRPAQLNAAPGEEPYWSPRFVFDPAALDAVIEDQKGKSGVIEPFQLQLVCRYAEAMARQKARAGEEEVTLTLADLGGVRGFKSVRQNFYRDTLRKLSPSQRKRAAVLCEEGLLGAGGHRLSLEEGQILRDFRVTIDSLDVLCQERLVVRERRLESVFYEISHDRLAESIFDARRMKIPRQLKRFLWAAAAAVVLLFAVLLWWNASVQRERIRADRARLQADEMLSFMLGEEFLGEVRDIGRSTLLEQVQKKVRETIRGGGGRAVNRGLALRNEGDVSRMHGDLKTASDRFIAALAAIESDFEADNDRLREIARTHDRLGEVFSEKGNVGSALEHYTAATSSWRRVAAAADPSAGADDCADLADSLVTLAELKLRMGDVQPALQDLESSVQIATNLLFGAEPSRPECGRKTEETAPYPDAKVLYVLSHAALVRWTIDGSDEDIAGAASLANEARLLRPPSVSVRRNALVALAGEGNSRRSTSPQKALEDYRKAMAEFEELRRWDTTNRVWQRERAACLLLVVQAVVACHTQEKSDCQQPPSLRDAEAMSLEAIATLEALATEDRDHSSLIADLVWNLRVDAKVLAAEKRLDEAVKKLDKAEQLFRGMKIDDRDADTRAEFARMLAEKSDVLERLGAKRESVATLIEAIRRVKQLTSAHPSNPNYMSDLVSFLNRAATLLPKTGDSRGGSVAAAEVQRMNASFSAMWKERDDVLTRSLELGATHDGRGTELMAKDDARAALREFNAAASAMRDYIRVRPAARVAYEKLYETYIHIGEAQKKLKEATEQTAAVQASMYAVQLAAWVTPPADREQLNTQLLVARYDLADRLYEQKRYRDAVPVVQEIVVIAETLAQGGVNDARYQQFLGRAKCSLGNYRRLADLGGWEEAIRSGLIHLGNAAASKPNEFIHAKDLAVWRQYLAEQLDMAGRKRDASEEFQRAMDDYRRAQRMNPADQDVNQAIVVVAQRLNGATAAR